MQFPVLELLLLDELDDEELDEEELELELDELELLDEEDELDELLELEELLLELDEELDELLEEDEESPLQGISMNSNRPSCDEKWNRQRHSTPAVVVVNVTLGEVPPVRLFVPIENVGTSCPA